MPDLSQSQILLRMVALLSSYGAVTMHDDDIEFHDGPAPPQAIIDAARARATSDATDAELSTECRRRIYSVVKSDATQANMQRAMTLIVSKQAGTRQALTAQEQADLQMLRALDAWIHAMRQAWRNPSMMVNNAYLDDKSWPKPPSGYGAFVARF